MIPRPTCIGWFALAILFLGMLAPWQSNAEDVQLLSIGIRARLGGQRVLGSEQPETFREYDLVAAIGLPWKTYAQSDSSWAAARLLASVGALNGAGKTALVASLIPVLALGDGWFTFDLGAGAALLSAHRFGSQDYGGPFQFALTVGVAAAIYRRLGAGYRFLHYSDAGTYGGHTIGADFHMVELTYRF